MGLDLNALRVIVYDLDGTVYDDTRHFELYAREIQSHLPDAVREAFWADYTAAVEGRHAALRIGTFYDAERDLILETRAGRAVRALHWDGSELPPLVRQSLYPGLVEPDHASIMNVGDLWWVPTAISAHHGGVAEKHQQAFLRIRDVMSDPEFVVRPISELQETIESLRGRVVQVLATNSPQPDSESIMRKVGLLGLFDRMYFRSNKPAGLKAIFDEVAADFGIPFHSILSVGDNLINEIAPAKAMGCQTVFIDPHDLGAAREADLVVRTMTDFLPTLRQLAAARA